MFTTDQDPGETGLGGVGQLPLGRDGAVPLPGHRPRGPWREPHHADAELDLLPAGAERHALRHL